ncbi:hypothetical protein F5Y01DRAFT_326667 [Xylaria sp. FL0043]|nr:hypothetical protein F5Y01DRAFT_326667 [Xylaria sp. FL0043]
MANFHFWNRTSWQDGSLEMTRGQFQEEIKRLQEEIGELLVERVHMRTSANQLAAEEVDAERWNKRANADDWAYIELLASRLKEPSGSTVTMKNPRNPDKQARWRKALIKAYGAETENGEFLWCPISQQYHFVTAITSAHIVRYNVGEPAAVHLFGSIDDADGHIWNIRNGILIYTLYEKMLDDGMIAIVPTKNGKDLMVTVLDETERTKKANPLVPVPIGQALHGRVLKFLNDHRPARRYLYFSFAINLLRRQKFEVDGWWRDRISYADTPFFPTPGKWVRETTLRKLAVRVGHLPLDEVDDFVAKTQGTKSEDPFQGEKVPVGEEETDDEEKEEVFTSYVQYACQK